MTRSEQIFRALLHAYPRSTREASGGDMVQLFTDRLRDAQTGRERTAVWLASIADIAVTAPRERLERRRVLRVAEGPAIDARRSALPDVGVASLPLIITALVLLAAPGYYSPFFDERVQLAGVTAGAAMLCVTAVVAAIGTFAARRREELGDPAIQAALVAGTLVIAPFLWFLLTLELPAHVAVVWATTAFVLVIRFRVVQVALVLPFVVWLLAGPAIASALIGQLLALKT